jgi:hypothetical protein
MAVRAVFWETWVRVHSLPYKRNVSGGIREQLLFLYKNVIMEEHKCDV